MATPSTKSNLSPATLLIAIVAALGFVTPAMVKAPAPPPTGPGSKTLASAISGARSKGYEHGAEDLIRDFLDSDPDQ